jgi:hypothetical protein
MRRISPGRRRNNVTALYLARSAINGKGVFSRKKLRAGIEVVACRGIMLSGSQVRDDMRAMQIGVDVYLAEDPNDPGIDDFVNHSCEPNVGFLDGSLKLYALRDIAEDEEIVFDYSTCMNEAGWFIDCRCRMSSCRGRIVGFDELAREERRRLSDIALAYLRGVETATESRTQKCGIDDPERLRRSLVPLYGAPPAAWKRSRAE